MKDGHIVEQGNHDELLTKDEVFALAVQRYSDTVFRAAMHNCSCTADAEDVVQDVFEKLLRYEGRFESEEHLKAWLLRVAINRCRDITRAARQKDTELDENHPCSGCAGGRQCA